ncbi:glycine betaine/L-proline ABC transporter ATP-binding protein [Rhodobacteraceae bacterium NNCM2]|nr:glycine betaine/L-proline ABC transporter ATP-binding protein [Coraliihabitans acroporae]
MVGACCPVRAAAADEPCASAAEETRVSDQPKIICRNVWKIFGNSPQRILTEISPSATRAEIQAESGHVVAVKDVSFEVQQGETFVVMGLSGSGKSTLVRCISRLIDPTGGEVVIDGEDVTKLNDKQLIELRRSKLSMVFQHFGLFPHRKIIDNIAFGLEIRGEPREERMARAQEVLELVGLGGWENHYPRELSGGMQQRVGLARAMAVDPEILIFDEPFSALDPLIRREMQDELLRLQSQMHKTMVFITHDFLEAIKMGDHIAIMKDGEVSQIGTPEEIVANPADQYVRDFTEDVPRYKVLSAGKVMRNAGARAESLFNDGVMVAANTKLDDLIDRAADQDDPLPVVDAEKRLIGEVDRSIIMKAMSTRG